jgi:NhaP-type Na+/H+ and K+/H+ antiporter
MFPKTILILRHRDNDGEHVFYMFCIGGVVMSCFLLALIPSALGTPLLFLYLRWGLLEGRATVKTHG